MARLTNRDFFNALGAAFRRPDRELPTPVSGTPIQSSAENPYIGTPAGSVMPTAGNPEPELPQEQVQDYGANLTTNEQTWSDPNAETAAFTGDAGFGRTDAPIGSSATQASGFVRTNISPGVAAGGVSTVPAAMRLPGDTIKVQPGDTMKTIAQRAYGDASFFQRLHVVQNDYVVSTPSSGDMRLVAGTVLDL